MTRPRCTEIDLCGKCERLLGDIVRVTKGPLAGKVGLFDDLGEGRAVIYFEGFPPKLPELTPRHALVEASEHEKARWVKAAAEAYGYT